MDSATVSCARDDIVKERRGKFLWLDALQSRSSSQMGLEFRKGKTDNRLISASYPRSLCELG
jgi:hypothetical protein